jgi:hypothetical protein
MRALVSRLRLPTMAGGSHLQVTPYALEFSRATRKIQALDQWLAWLACLVRADRLWRWSWQVVLSELNLDRLEMAL